MNVYVMGGYFIFQTYSCNTNAILHKIQTFIQLSLTKMYLTISSCHEQSYLFRSQVVSVSKNLLTWFLIGWKQAVNQSEAMIFYQQYTFENVVCKMFAI